MSHTCPPDDYTSPQKHQSRLEFNQTMIDTGIVELMKRDPTKYLVVVPCTNGEQIRLAIEAGVPESQIIAFDRKREVVDTSAWVKRYPKVITLEMNAEEGVGWYFRKHNLEGTIIALDLDLCGNISNTTERNFERFIENSPMDKNALVAFTIAKGREQYLDYVKSNSVKEFRGYLFSSIRLGYLLTLSAIRNRCSSIISESNHKPDGYGTRMERLIVRF